MKKIIIGLVLIGLFSLSSYAGKYGTAVTQGGKAKITFRVLDDEQNSVAQVKVQAGFYYNPEKQGIITGETDTNGLCAVEGVTCMDMWYSMEKSGYYETEGRYVFGMVEPPVINNRWQPWNPTNTVVLKRIKNPVPMYVKKVETVIPALNQPIGFDFEKGDWVSPYGKGSRTDMLFFATGKFDSNLERNSFLEITFPNQKDGIKTFEIPVKPEFNDRSMFASPYFSSEFGYATNWIYERKITPTRDGRINPSPRENMNFFFRAQTVVNGSGEIISAKYGKIYGDIICDFADEKNLGVYFTYYLNPTFNDRNVEFDPDKNLFGGRDRFAP
ncbi:MAG: hypothetical protein HOO88_07090 [Kiritimatiellaceae bacterium]|nr:hypothetical protein [Kiritimatiellaceae bacterium]